MFLLAGSFQFLGDQVSVSTRDGGMVRLEGTGRFNGRAGYRFLAEARDGARMGQAGPDRMRVRISHFAPGGAEVLDYDNGGAPGAPPAVAAADQALLDDGDLAVRDGRAGHGNGMTVARPR